MLGLLVCLSAPLLYLYDRGLACAEPEKSADSSLSVTGISSLMLTGGKRLEDIVLSRVSSSVANVGFARAEESADSSLSVTGISSLMLTGGKRLEGIVLSRVSSSVANVGLARAEESAR
jgi:hypothetical protein